MKEFFHSKIFKLFVALAIVVFAFLLRATMTEGFSTVVAQIVGVVTTPLQSVTSGFSDSVTEFLYKFVRVNDISDENEALREENRQLLEQMVDYETYKHENEMLKRQLEIKEKNPTWETQTASVIGRDPVGRFYSFTIDKGTLEGINYKDPVITADGLVGIVYEVGPTFAQVMTILDVSLNVGGQDVRTQDVATVSGDIALAQQGQCRMSLIPRESGVAKGDIIQTSGTSGLYPKGLIIGRVAEVNFESHGTSLYAVIEPTNDIKNIKDVIVITSFEGQGSSLSSFEDEVTRQLAEAAGQNTKVQGGNEEEAPQE